MQAHLKYAKTQNSTASAQRLMVMLFQAAMRHLRHGAQAAQERKRQEVLASVEKASRIVEHLLSTLNHDAAPALCSNLSDVYTFVLLRLSLAMTSGTAAPILEAERVLGPVATAFEEAVAAEGRHP